jgi:hypothetical protein
MDKFGCCSSYLECSKLKKCIHAADPDYSGCAYNSNLLAGRVFYGDNSSTQEVIEPEPTHKPLPEHKETSIFLYCFDRLFSISTCEKEGFSRSLSQEQFDKVEQAFINAHIPYKLQIDSSVECVIDKPTVDDLAPANARVAFELEGEKFHLLNYNSWLIKRSIAEKIAKALDNNYITAYVDLYGQYSQVSKINFSTNEVKLVNRPVEQAKPQKTEDKKPDVPKEKVMEDKPVTCAQISLFDMLQVNEPENVLETWANTQKINNTVKQISIPDPEPVKPIQSSNDSVVIAADEYWGTYRGELVETHMTKVGELATVRILETIKMPRQDAIYNKNAIVKREPYAIGSEHSFKLQDVNCLSEVSGL